MGLGCETVGMMSLRYETVAKVVSAGERGGNNDLEDFPSANDSSQGIQPRLQSEIKSPFSIAFICSTGCRIPESANTNQGTEKRRFDAGAPAGMDAGCGEGTLI